VLIDLFSRRRMWLDEEAEEATPADLAKPSVTETGGEE